MLITLVFHFLCFLYQNGTKPTLHEDVDLTSVARNPLCDGFTGADLAALVRDASMLALSEIILSCKNDSDFAPVFVTAKHFEQALQNLRPSVAEKVNIFIFRVTKNYSFKYWHYVSFWRQCLSRDLENCLFRHRNGVLLRIFLDCLWHQNVESKFWDWIMHFLWWLVVFRNEDHKRSWEKFFVFVTYICVIERWKSKT